VPLESKPKARLAELLREAFPKFVVQRHEDRYNGGTPDFSIDGNRRTSWWECKDVTDEKPMKQNELQKRMMVRLNRQTYSRYIIWSHQEGIEQTFIVVPSQINSWMTTENFSDIGFDHRFVINAVRRVHYDQERT